MTYGPQDDISQVSVAKANCPECGKRNSFVTYADGHSVCFNKGCGHRAGIQPPDTRPKADPIPHGLLKPDGGSYSSIRMISTDTLRRYGAFLGGYKGDRQLVVPVYSNTGEMVAQQVRMKDGGVEIVGERGTNRQLLGQHVFGDRNDRRVIVHSDAVDMMSTGQVTRVRQPCVSVLSEATALEDIKANYRWLDRYGEIILFFHDSPEWQKRAQEAASLFGAGKVKIAILGEYKSANEALQAHRPGDIEDAIYSAGVWRPPGIINARDDEDAFFEAGMRTPSWPYPWDIVNRCSMGMHPGTVTYHVGGTGIAKSTIMFHMVNHLITDTGAEFLENYPRQEPTKVAFLGFEDLPHQAKTAMMGIHTGKMLALEPLAEAAGRKLYKELFGSGKLELYDAEQAEYGLEAIKGYVRYVVKALGCRVVFLDPLTFIVSQLPAANRTQAEDQLAGWMAAETKAMGIALHVGYHLRKPDGTPFEEGAPIGLPDIKGSGALTHFSHNVIAYERDQQGARPDLMRMRWLKNRIARFTGIGAILKYDMATGRYTPTDEEWPEEDSKNTKKGKASAPRASGGDRADY